MAVKVIGWVWDHSQAEGAARLVLLAIADCTNASGSDAWPSMTELCRKTRLSERGIQKAIRKLEEIGELKVTKNVGRGRTNRYEVNLETPNTVQGSADAETRTEDGVTEEPNPEQGAPRTQFAPEHSSPQTPNVVRETPNHVHPEPSEPSLEPSVPTGAPPAQALVAEWIEHCRQRPPQRVVGHVAKEINSMLREGIAYTDVRAGLATWHQKGLNPAALASVVHEVMNAPSKAATAKPSTTDQRVATAQALKAHYQSGQQPTIRGEIAR